MSASPPSVAPALAAPSVAETGPAAARRLNEITIAQRIFFVVIAANALFVSYLGLLAPASMDRTFTWAVLPPLHAGFVGMLYLFGAVFVIGCIVSRRAAQAAVALPAIALFTGLLMFATLLNLEAFDFGTTPVWVWTLSYAVYPVVALALAWSARGRPAAVVGGPALPPWARAILAAQAAVFAIVGLLLLIVPSAMVDVWPWPVSAGLAQFYGGPFLAYAICSLLYARRDSWAELSVVAPAMFVFTAGTIVVSLMHSELFSSSDLASWAWYGGFGSAAIAFAVMSAKALPAGRGRAEGAAP